MNFLILNLTNNPIPITRVNMEQVIVNPHKHYLLETVHRPEINFWQNCTDGRFRVIVDQKAIDRYLKVIHNQEVNNTSTVTAKVDNVVTESSKTVTKEESVDNTVSDNNVSVNENTITDEVIDVSKIKYTEESLLDMKVTELRELAATNNVAVPTNCNKATLVTTLYNELNK